jgi:hypothetical protein
MRDGVYYELRTLVNAVRRQLEALPAGAPMELAEWVFWARGFCAGLYHRKTAQSAARAAWIDAVETAPDAVTRALAYAASDAAWAVVSAIDGDEAEAEAVVRAVRARLASLDRGRDG